MPALFFGLEVGLLDRFGLGFSAARCVECGGELRTDERALLLPLEPEMIDLDWQEAREVALDESDLERQAEEEAAEAVESMRAKGYRLVTRLEDGDGVFVREDGLELDGTMYGSALNVPHWRWFR